MNFKEISYTGIRGILQGGGFYHGSLQKKIDGAIGNGITLSMIIISGRTTSVSMIMTKKYRIGG